MIVEEQISIVEEQISARQQRARKAIQKILTGPVGQAYGDYVVKSASARKYRVAMRGPSLFENFCSCADFAMNTLGTCKHIEALLLCLHRRFGRSFDRQQYQRTRASLSLHYGDMFGAATQYTNRVLGIEALFKGNRQKRAGSNAFSIGSGSSISASAGHQG